MQYEIGESVALRHAFGPNLVPIAESRDDVVAVTADLGGSLNIGPFAEQFPERYYNCGVAEESMIGICAGLAAQGFLPFALTFASFLGRGVDHIRQSIGHNRLKVVVVGSHGGISNGMDGPSAHAIEDVAIMRAMPSFAVVAPSDPNQMEAVLRAVAEYPTSVYLRLYREPLPVVFSAEEGREFEIGKASVHHEGSDITLVATGPHVGFCREWLPELADLGSIELIGCPTITPLDEDTILASVRKTGRVVTVEDHLLAGGLGAAVAELLGEQRPAPLRRVGLSDYATSGPYFELRDALGLGLSGVRGAVQSVLSA